MRRRAPQINFPAWTQDTKVTLHSWNKKKLKVEAFACACGGKFAMEVDTFLVSVRAHHSETIYLLTDKQGAKNARATIEHYEFENIVIFEEIDEDYAKKVEKLAKNIASHSNYWSITWIYAKLDVFLRACEAESGKGVMLLDGDIILNRPIVEEWEATAVLSAHSLTRPMRKNYDTYGFWNAGMVLTNNRSFVKNWINLFLKAGAGSFYEQKCMEELASKWVIDSFPESFNMGKWRREDLALSKRDVASFHLHWNEGDQFPEQPFTHKLAKRAIMDNRTICELRKVKLDKLAFVHHPRNAGTYVREYIQYGGVSKTRSVQVLDSWIMKLNREWTEQELLLIANDQLLGMDDRGRYFVHNHTFGWTEKALKEMKENGYVTFSFLREPEDAIISVWYYFLKHWPEYNVIWHNEKNRSGKALESCNDINEAILALCSDRDLRAYWQLPSWFDQVDSIMKWSETRFSTFLKYVYRFDHIPVKKANASENPGFKALCESGELKPETIDLLITDPSVIRWREFYNKAT